MVVVPATKIAPAGFEATQRGNAARLHGVTIDGPAGASAAPARKSEKPK